MTPMTRMTRIKRTFDLCGALLGLVVVAPVLAAIALVIVLFEGRPAFFRQERVGAGGRTFRMWKFRTMVVGAERMGAPLTVGNDRRVTRVGGWLRRRKLDELPQLLNVVAGDMSLVGPRPEVPHLLARYTPAQREVLGLVPGITDPASLRFYDEATLLARVADPERFYFEEIVPEKIRLNLHYAREATPLTDLAVIASTMRRIAARRPRDRRRADGRAQLEARPDADMVPTNDRESTRAAG